MAKKFKLTKEIKLTPNGGILYRIQATTNFGNVVKGELGGWVEKEENLEHFGNAWVYGNASVYGNARVFGDASVYGNAWVSGDARITKPVLNFINFAGYNLTSYCDFIQIGCKLHTKKEWAKIFKDKTYLDLASSKNDYKKYELAYKFILSLDKLEE